DTTTSKNPLVIRYPLSNSSIKIILRYYIDKGECKIPNSTGSFTLLRQAVKEKFDKLEKTEINDINFEYFQGNVKKGEIVENEFHFNTLVDNIQLNDKNERIINYLKVQIKGKKVYGDWEVAKIYDDLFTSSETIGKFEIGDLPELSPSLDRDELKSF
ncbi:5212_t:CDS:2, partial [Funneliformis geosporum]